MEKSRSFPNYSTSYCSGLGYESGSNSYSFNGPTSSSDPELKRKKRVASYNVFTVQGKLKASVRNSFRWIKNKLDDIRY